MLPNNNFDAMYLSPSPFEAAKGSKKTCFYNLPPDIKIKLYNMKAENVFEAEDSALAGLYCIDLSVQKMKTRLASGIYIYIIEDKNGNRTTGKLAIIR